ncbi:hypothetical protein [Bacillus sp. FJAT-45350]|uniref:hypothetical protein n=1 Tax=Bacillus sp. FJAT-45350 TaxID=2011014 RepID=UPI000BB71C8B|nr:hypothetical protein [Bacillus sp. FJAT-45350]
MRNKPIKIISIFLIFSLSLNAIFLLSQWISGYLLTVTNVPDIVDAYEQAGTLPNEVTFGTVYNVTWWSNPFFSSSLITSILLTIYIYRIKSRVNA